jgi:hypothetical protein
MLRTTVAVSSVVVAVALMGVAVPWLSSTRADSSRTVSKCCLDATRTCTQCSTECCPDARDCCCRHTDKCTCDPTQH